MELKKDVSFQEFLVSVDIKGVGAKTAEEIVSKIRNVSTFRYHIETGTIVDILLDTKGIGEATKDLILEEVHNFDFLMKLEELEDKDYEMFKDLKVYMLEELVEIKEETKEEKLPSLEIEDLVGLSSMTGLNFVITGTLSRDRNFFKDLISNAGGNLRSAVGNSTHVLILGDDQHGSTKHKKALELSSKRGTPIIMNEETFRKTFKGSYSY